jgi:hypothetical protein
MCAPTGLDEDLHAGGGAGSSGVAVDEVRQAGCSKCQVRARAVSLNPGVATVADLGSRKLSIT